MRNSIESIELCFRIGESTLKYVSSEFKQNPFDRRVKRSLEESLDLLEPLINEAEFVHGNIEVANVGKRIYDTYAINPKYGIIVT